MSTYGYVTPTLERSLRLAQTHLRGAVRQSHYEAEPETTIQLRELLAALEAVSGGRLRRRRHSSRQTLC